MLPERMKIRRAKASDYEQIMDISRDVYAGVDYLPSLYFELLSDINTLLFVGELDGEIVSMKMKINSKRHVICLFK